MAPASVPAIPVINLSSFFSESATPAAKENTAKEVVEKCSINGCIAITGHGIPTEFLDESFNLAKRLFDLPMGEKMKAPHPAEMVPHRGYSAPGKERTFEKDEFNASDADHRSMLQATQDWKVSVSMGRCFLCTRPLRQSDASLICTRKAMRWATTRIREIITSGSPMTHCPIFVHFPPKSSSACAS